MDAITKLCVWYESQWVRDLHEDFGIRIDTLDNPGWSLKINLVGTGLEDKGLQETKVERSEQDWFVIRRNAQRFEAFGGPKNLDEMTDASGNLQDLYKYGPYGEPKNGSNVENWSGLRFRYTVSSSCRRLSSTITKPGSMILFMEGSYKPTPSGQRMTSICMRTWAETR